MAAAMAQAKIADLGLPWTASSAGLSAMNGMPMSPLSAQALTRRHIPLARHKSTMVHKTLVDTADLILCMTRSHAAELKHRFPKASDKIRCLGDYLLHPGPSDYTGGGVSTAESDEGWDSSTVQGDIHDPFGGSDEAYEKAARDIEQALTRLFEELTRSHPKEDDGDK
jgi:protein arginine phosphatase